jgi:hypothetical protein
MITPIEQAVNFLNVVFSPTSPITWVIVLWVILGVGSDVWEKYGPYHDEIDRMTKKQLRESLRKDRRNVTTCQRQNLELTNRILQLKSEIESKSQ